MDYSPLLIVACAVLLGWWITRQIRTYNVSTSPPRPDRRIPADELALTGPDWRDPVAPYFRSRFESHTRTRLAIAATCGADPEKREGQPMPRPALASKQGDTLAPNHR